ncbi:hypothetical protein [Endozoicomonas sp. ALC066]|uniref:hypothetical protein n=1 Tax=Endozoicomonas sp. ALC066 TaxID=3403078 RepID=UPI003BB79170
MDLCLPGDDKARGAPGSMVLVESQWDSRLRGNDENEAGNEGSQLVPTLERVLRHPLHGGEDVKNGTEALGRQCLHNCLRSAETIHWVSGESG